MYIPESFFESNELITIFDEIIKSEKIKTTNPKNSAVCVESFGIYQQHQQILKQSTNHPITVNILTSKLGQSIDSLTISKNPQDYYYQELVKVKHRTKSFGVTALPYTKHSETKFNHAKYNTIKRNTMEV